MKDLGFTLMATCIAILILILIGLCVLFFIMGFTQYKVHRDLCNILFILGAITGIIGLIGVLINILFD